MPTSNARKTPFEKYVLLFVATSILWIQSKSEINADGTLRYSILEKKPVGTTVGNVALEAGLYGDLSADIVQKLSFTIAGISGSPNATAYFRIVDGIGLLQIKAVIEREAICPQRSDCNVPFNVLVQPKDYFRVIKVNVSVVDINDFTPVFDPEFVNISIPESSAVGELLPLPGAVDLDSPANGIAGYVLDPDADPFRLVVYNSSGTLDPRLNLTSYLDRELQGFYSLKLIASDGGNPPRTGSLTIDVTVLDTNDNSPVFDVPVYVVNVSESVAVSTELVTVHATDRDTGANGRVRYGFSQRSQNQFGTIFRIDPDSGRVSLLRPLTGSAAPSSYSLSVQAVDGSSDGLAGFAAIRISVQPDPDRAPVISVDFLNGDGAAKIQEYSESGTFVALVSVAVRNDRATICSVNDTVNFLLLPLLPNENKLVTTRPLDASVQNAYWVALTCALNNDASIFSATVFPITIVHASVKPPVFLNSTYSAKVPAYVPADTFVLDVRAEIGEIRGRNLTVAYALDKNSAPGDRFKVDSQTGVIATTYAYFRNSEIGTTVELYVVAFYRQLGNSNVTSRATVRVAVAEGVTKPPKFQQNFYSFRVPETTDINSTVGGVVAFVSADDSASYGLTSRDVNETSSAAFRIDVTTGVIYLAQFLGGVSAESRYELSAVVRSARFADLNDRAGVDIYVEQNRPEITFSGLSNNNNNKNNNTVYASSSSPPGTLVATVNARLPRPGLLVCFSLSDNYYPDLFTIGVQTGEIRLKSNLSGQSNRTLSVEFQARVCSFPFARSVAVLYVTVTDDDATTVIRSSPAPSRGNGDAGSRTVILACVLGVCLVLVLIVVVAIVCVCRRSRDQRKTTNEALYAAAGVPTAATRSETLQYPVIFDRRSNCSKGRAEAGSGQPTTKTEMAFELPQTSPKSLHSEDIDSGYPSNSNSSQTSNDDGGGGGEGRGGGEGGGGGDSGEGGVAGVSDVGTRGRDHLMMASSFIGPGSNKGVGGKTPIFTTATSSSGFHGTEVADWLKSSPEEPLDDVIKPDPLSRSGSLASRRSTRLAGDGTLIIDAKKRVTFAEDDQLFQELAACDVINDGSDVTDSPRSDGGDVSSETSSSYADSVTRRTIVNTISNSYAPSASRYPPPGVAFGDFRPQGGSLV